MENYKYSIGNVFLLRNLLNVVVYISKEELFCLTNNTNSDGEISSNWQVTKYDLTKKVELEKLSFLAMNSLPTTKFGQVGSLMVYGVNDYLLLGVVNRTLGTFTFKKPLLLELNKIVRILEAEIEDGNDDLDLIVAQLWDSCTKIPFESDKNISLTLLQEPQLPIRNFTIIEVESVGKPQNQGSGNSEEIMPPLINIRNISNLTPTTSRILSKENIIIGVNFSSNTYEMVNFATELNFNILGKKNIDSIRYANENLTIRGLYLTTGRSRNPFILSGKESLFPDWKLDMDNEFLCGDAFSNNDYTILGKVLFFEEGQHKTKFGVGAINHGDAVGNKKYATQFMLWHPQIFQGYNIDFGTSSNDNFLTIKNDLIGLKNGGLSSFLISKSIGSPTYPIKTRAFLKKNNVTTLNQKIVENKAIYDSGTLAWSSDTTTFFPLSYKKNVEDYYVSDQIKRWDIENQSQSTMSWDKFRMISSNTQSQVKESNYLQFFDYGNLNSIQNTNPILFDKLVLLINKATDIYENLTPVVTQQSSNLNIVEYVGLELHYHQFVLYYYDKSKERARISGGSLKLREYEIRGTDPINSELKQLFYDPIYQFMLDNKIFARQADQYNLNGVHIELSKLNQLKTFIKGKYIDIIISSIDKNEFYSITTEFSLRVTSLASNYFAFQGMDSQYGGYGQLLPETIFKLNDLQRYSQSYTSEVQVTNVMYLDLITSILDENLKNTIREFLKELITLSVEKYELFLRLKRWKDLVQLFGYYEVVKTQVKEVGLRDIHNDIRFKYFLRDSHLLGFFTEKDVDELVMYLAQVNNIITKIYLTLKDEQEFRFSCSLDLNYFPDFVALDISASTLEQEFPSNAYYLRSTDKTVAFQFALLKPELYGEKIREIMDMMKEDEVVGRLLTGETTPSQEWYRIFGGEITTTIPIQIDEEIIEVEDDFDFDSLDLDIDNIQIDLSDDDLLEENIEI